MVDTAPLRYLATTPADARRFVRAALRRWPSSMIDAAELLTSEVVTNAIVHGRSTTTPIGVGSNGSTIRIEVDDPSQSQPVTVDKTDPTVPGGWGIGIVGTYASAWGVASHPGDGKTVWFELDSALQPV